MTEKPKRPRDANQLAKFIVDLATEGESAVPLPHHEGQREGGLKGGKARADKLSPEDRAEIARKAAKARWLVPVVLRYVSKVIMRRSSHIANKHASRKFAICDGH